jgi:formate dehydrogenase subunit delta
MNAEHLARMANEIGAFFVSGNEDAEAARLIADHLRRFWDPRMRKQIVAYVDAGGAHLDAPVRQAIDLLRSPSPSP